MNIHRSRRHAPGFTLIELLVTLAVIGVLAAFFLIYYPQQKAAQSPNQSVAYTGSTSVPDQGTLAPPAPGTSQWATLGEHGEGQGIPAMPPPPPPPLTSDAGSGAGEGPDYDPAAVDRILAKLHVGNLVFSTPGTLKLGDATQVQLVLSEAVPLAELSREITVAGGRESAQIKVANRMQAALTSSGMQVTPESETIQAVGTGSTLWQWGVTATQAGPQNLHLEVSVILVIDGEKTPKTIKTFDRTIQVYVVPDPWWRKPLKFLADNWQYFMGVLVIPAAGYLWRWWKRRRKKR